MPRSVNAASRSGLASRSVTMTSISSTAHTRANARWPSWSCRSRSSPAPRGGHEVIDAGLALVMGGGSGPRVQRVDAEDGPVQGQLRQPQGGERADQLVRCRASLCRSPRSDVLADGELSAMFIAFVTTVTVGSLVPSCRSGRAARAPPPRCSWYRRSAPLAPGATREPAGGRCAVSPGAPRSLPQRQAEETSPAMAPPRVLVTSCCLAS